MTKKKLIVCCSVQPENGSKNTIKWNCLPIPAWEHAIGRGWQKKRPLETSDVMSYCGRCGCSGVAQTGVITFQKNKSVKREREREGGREGEREREGEKSPRPWLLWSHTHQEETHLCKPQTFHEVHSPAHSSLVQSRKGPTTEVWRPKQKKIQIRNKKDAKRTICLNVFFFPL